MRLTPDIATKLGLSVAQVKKAIDDGKFKGKKLSDRIYLIDDSEVPAEAKPEQAAIPNTDGKPNPLNEAEQAARIAKANADEAEQIRKRKIAELGCKDLEEAQKQIAELKRKAEDALKYTEQVKAENVKRMEELVAEKQDVAKINARLQLREKECAAKLADAENLNQDTAAKLKRYEDIKVELKELVVYHQQNIIPVTNTLKRITKTIYQWIEPLSATKYDFSKLYNFLCGQTEVLEKYVAGINKTKEPPKD